MDSPQILNLFWQLMFGKDYQSFVDPNDPLNKAYIKHKQDQETRAVKSWLSSGGEHLMEKMMKRVKHRMYEFASISLDTEGDKENAITKLKQYQMEVEFLMVLLSAIQKTNRE